MLFWVETWLMLVGICYTWVCRIVSI